jgi:PAS domain S-box-containing protein
MANDILDLKSELALLRQIVENSLDVITVATAEGKVEFEYPVSNSMFGYPRDEIIGHSAFEKIHPEDLPAVIAAFKEGVMTGIPQRVEYRYLHMDGHYLYLESIGKTYTNERGETKVIINTRDISEKKQKDNEIIKLNETLEKRVKERTKELETFTYTVSHDLRAPLRAIDGFIQILLEDNYEKLEDDGKRLINIVSKNARKMKILIDDLLDFSRMRKKEFRNEVVNMQRLVKSVLEEAVSAASADHSQEVEYKFANDLPDVNGDLSLLRQVWINYISNALKYSRTKPKAEIEIGSYEEDDKIIFYIKDKGIGFNMLYYNKLFGIFQRLHNVEEIEGTGIGLVIVKSIIDRHEGSVWAEGKENEGASFYFSLPLKKPV